MRMIKWASDIIAGNLREARKYAEKAHELRDINKAAADWCKEMAQKHLEFKKMSEDYAASGKNSELAPGMKAVYEATHADLMRESAEIAAMIAGYK